MTRAEILAHIVMINAEIVALQNRLRDLYLQIKSGLDVDEPVE